MAKIQHFLLVFDHARGELVEELHFNEDGPRALAAYADMEDLHKDEPSIEIVLIGSDSIDTVKLTHANYFRRHGCGLQVPCRHLATST